MKLNRHLLASGSGNHLQPKSLGRVLTLLDLKCESRFLDLGSSLGAACLLPSMLGVSSVTGIEREESLVAAARELTNGYDIEYRHEDIMQLKLCQLRGFTHAFSFDKVFGAETFTRVRNLVTGCPSFRFVASTHGPGFWPREWLLLDKVDTRLAGSAQRIRMYVYRRSHITFVAQ